MILHSFSQETDLLMKVIMKCVNIKLWDILGCFHYILNAPRNTNGFLKVHPTCHNIVNCIKPGCNSKKTDKHAVDFSKAVCWGVK